MRVFSDYFTTWHEGMEMRRTAIAAVRNGFAVVPVRPSEKVPLCTLTDQELRRQGLDHPCGTRHAITDDKVADRVFKRLTKHYGPDLNIGIVAYPSRLVVVDIDTIEALEAFRSSWAQATEDAGYLTDTPTVTTPGTRRGGEWKHVPGGGHWYFNVPDGIELDPAPGKMVLPGGAEVSWGWFMTVAPPSRRDEGRYLTNGDIQDVPAWLLRDIRAFLEHKTQRALHDAERWANDAIARWAGETAWSVLLERHGWRMTGKLDRRCGCPTVERPGGGSSSDRSAIAHENDCELYENYEGHGCIHLFTTELEEPLRRWCDEHGTATLTKLQWVAAMEHDGDIDAAKIALGIGPDLTLWPLPDPLGSDRQPPAKVEDKTPAQRVGATGEPRGNQPNQPPSSEDRLRAIVDGLREEYGLPETELPDLLKLGGQAVRDGFKQKAKERFFATSSTTLQSEDDDAAEMLDAAPPMIATHLARTDEQLMFYAGQTNLILGRQGAGKTWMSLENSRQSLLLERRVAYVDLEDSARNLRGRFTTMGYDIATQVHARRFRRLGSGSIPALLDKSGCAQLVEMLAPYDDVVFDVLGRLVVRAGGDLNYANTETSFLYSHLFDELAAVNTMVLILTHPSKADSQRGADARYIDPLGGIVTTTHLSGLAVALDPIRSITAKNLNGQSEMYNRKDRGGVFAEGEWIGTFRSVIGTSTWTGTTCLDFQITPPDTKPEDADADLLTTTKERIVTLLARARDKGLPGGTIKQNLSEHQRGQLDFALLDLDVDGVVTKVKQRFVLTSMVTPEDKEDP